MRLLGRSWAEVVQDAAAREIAVVEGESELRFPSVGCVVWPQRAVPDTPLAGVSLAG